MLAQGLYLSCSWSISLASFLIKLLFSFYTSSCHSFLYSQTLLTSFFIAFSVQICVCEKHDYCTDVPRDAHNKRYCNWQKIGHLVHRSRAPKHAQRVTCPVTVQDFSYRSLQHWAVHYHTATGIDGCG